MTEIQLFDDWPDRYDQWFDSAVGRFIKEYESELILEMIGPAKGELILDAGCGTGIFTLDLLRQGANVVGLDLSLTMIVRACAKGRGLPFSALQADMLALPFGADTFDKTVSITAIEFIQDGQGALAELMRVTKPGGTVLVATLNSLSPWADRRGSSARKKGHPIFDKAIFRSPSDMRTWAAAPAAIRTAVHFPKDAPLTEIPRLEAAGRLQELDTGAFIAATWIKPQSSTF